MKLSKPKSVERQLKLWDEPLGNHGHIRTVLGDMAEMLTAKFFKGIRYKTDSTADYSPDVGTKNIYLEVKAAGLSNQTFIYKGRVEKDREFVKAGYNLAYVVWWHGVKTARASTEEELRCLFLKLLKGVFIIPWEEIDKIVQTLPEEKLNSKYGKHGQGGYGSGYRLNISLLRPFKVFSFNDTTDQEQACRKKIRHSNRSGYHRSVRPRLVQS